MPSIGEVTGSNGRRERRRPVVGLGLVVVGALFVGIGAAGTVSGDGPKTGLFVGAVAIVVSLAVFATRLGLREHERALLAVGAVVAAASSLFLWALTPAAVIDRPLLTAVGGLGYLAGVAVMLASMVASVTLGREHRPSGRTRRSVSWSRSSGRHAVRERAADGGTADEELSSLLEDE